MTQKIGKERNYREVLEVLSGLGIKSHNKIQMLDGRVLEAQEYLEEKLRDDNSLSVSIYKVIPDYWIISGQVFKNKEDFVKQQMVFNPEVGRENWEDSFEHFAIPVYRDPIFVSGYEKGVKTSFVRQNKVLQERLNTTKKTLTDIIELSEPLDNDTLMSVVANIAGETLAAIEA